MNVILTSYFTTKPDPQSGNFVEPDSLELMEGWLDSLTALDLNGVIFHDEPISMDNGYIDNVLLQEYQLDREWSVNDERFLCYLNYLNSRPEIENIFMTDLFDVTFFKSPFDLICDDYNLYLGVGAGFNKPIGVNKWLKNKMMIAFDAVHYSTERIVNAGVIGGKRDDIMILLNCMVGYFERINSDKNINMAVFNRTVYEKFNPGRLLIGPPVTSLFKKYETSGDFAVKHK